MKQVNRKLMSGMIIVSLILVWGFPARASEYPNKPITLVLPYAPGGMTDLVARALAKKAEMYLGQPIICDNKPGGGGSLGPSLVVQKSPDGYTLSTYGITAMVSYHMGTLTFHPVDDITPIIRVTGYLFGILVRTDSQWNTIQELVEYARRNPKKLSYASAGVGTPCFLCMEDLCMTTGMQLTHIPYKSDAETITALLGGHVDMLSAASVWVPFVDAGKLRLLATLGEKRSKKYPNVPVLSEVFNLVPMEAPIAVIGPKGLPNPIVQKLHDSLKKGMDTTEFQAILEKFYMSNIYQNSDDYSKQIKQDFERTGKLVKNLGLQKK